MTYSKEIHKFIKDIVSKHAIHNWEGCSLKISNLSDFDVEEFTSLMLINSPELAAESTSPDNPEYEKTMLPALIKYMRNTSDMYEQIKFNETWSSGISNYFLNILENLIEEECNQVFENRFHSHINPNDGDLIWRKHA